METPAVEVMVVVNDREEVTAEAESEILEELLVEEISIDGMCGVY